MEIINSGQQYPPTIGVFSHGYLHEFKSSHGGINDQTWLKFYEEAFVFKSHFLSINGTGLPTIAGWSSGKRVSTYSLDVAPLRKGITSIISLAIHWKWRRSSKRVHQQTATLTQYQNLKQFHFLRMRFLCTRRSSLMLYRNSMMWHFAQWSKHEMKTEPSTSFLRNENVEH